MIDVTDPNNPTPIPNKTITFTLGGQTFTAVTDSTGTAATGTTVQDRLNQIAGAKTVVTTFGPDPVYSSANDSDPYTVVREDVTISRIDPAAIQVTSTNDLNHDGNVDALVLTLTVDESQDGYLSGALPGAGLANAKPINVTLQSITSASGTYTCTANDTAYVTGDPDTAVAHCTIANLPPDVYDAIAVTDGTTGDNYFAGSGEGAVVVYNPSLGFTTGGGWYTDNNSNRVNFGFVAKTLKSGQIQGSVLLIVHAPEGNYTVKSNVMGTLSISKDATGTFYTATLTGKATYSIPPSQGLLYCNDRKCGGYTFTVYVEDRQEPGTGFDRFWIQVKDPSGVIVTKVSLAPPAATNAKTIDGGNIQVPQPQGH